MKKKKYLLFFIIIFISIGFAYLSTNLNITGSSLIKGNSWDVHFENVQVTSGSVTATTPTITNNAHQVNYTVTLNMPGDYFEFTVDAVNDGTIDAMVDTVSNTGLTEDQLKYLDYTVKLANDEPLNHGYILLNQTTKTYKVRLEYKLDISEDDLPDSDQTISLTFTVNYTQTDEDAYKTSTFKTGEEVSELMYNLAGEDARNVKSFLQASQKNNSVTNDNIASTTDSDTPIYLWFEADTTTNDGTGSIYWYSDADIVYLNENCYYFFSVYINESEKDHFMNLTDISGLYDISASKVKELTGFFNSCESLEDIKVIKDWNISKVESMNYMFSSCKKLTDISPIQNWNIDNVKSMWLLFQGCTQLEDISPLSNWDVSKVDDLHELFEMCLSLKNLTPLSNWTFKKSASVRYMFCYCSSLTDLTPISNWNLTNLTDISAMFENCTSLEDLTPLASWNTKNIENMEYMFYNCANITDLTALSNWDVSKVTKFNNIFSGCTGLTSLMPIANWNIKNADDISGMFYSCTGLNNLSPLANWNISNVTNISAMFGNCTSLNDISALSSWNTQNVKYMHRMFQGCTNLLNAKSLENWDVRSVTNMRNMFTDTATTSSTRPSWYTG